MANFRKLLPLIAVALAAGCGQGPRSVPAPLDRFTFPTGLTLAPLANGNTALVVVSSNFDLRYSPENGGSVIAVDPDLSDGDQLQILGAVRIGSFGGEAAVLSALPLEGAGASCPGYAAEAQVLVPSRNANALYRIGLGTDGKLTCDEAQAVCKVPLDPGLADPFAVQVVCRTNAAGAPEQSAYVTHLRSPQNRGVLTKLDLATGAQSAIDLLSTAPTGSFAYDVPRQRLYVTGRFGSFDLAPLHWLDLAVQGAAATANLLQDVRGSELRGLAISSDGTRGFAAVRLFDRDLAGALGGRTPDTGGALAVIDLVEGPLGGPRATVLQVVPVGIGPSQVAVLPRPGKRDLVAIASTDDGTVSLYDDETGAIAAVLGRPASATTEDELRPFGKQPYGLVSRPLDASTRRLYVGSFDRGFIREVDVNLDAPALSRIGKKFGREVP